MILLIFGSVYAVCLAVLAIVFLKAKPLGSASRGDPGSQHHQSEASARPTRN